jgi:hypothetical protein
MERRNLKILWGYNAVYRAKSDFSMRAGWGIGFMAKSGRRLVEMTVSCVF